VSNQLQVQVNNLLAQGKTEEALSLLLPACSENPDPETYYLLAGVYGVLQRFTDAEQACRDALALDDGHALSWFRLGNAVDAQKRHIEAIDYYTRALELAPGLAHGWNNLGAACMSSAQLERAASSFRKAVELDDSVGGFYINLGMALLATNAEHEAGACFSRAAALGANDTETQLQLTMMGIRLMTSGKVAEAERLFRYVLDCDDSPAASWVNLGLSQAHQNHYVQAIDSFRRALAIEPENAEAAWSLSLALLAEGDYEQGWPLYEWRWRRGHKTLPEFAVPQWQGEDLSGKTLFVHPEQGFGDSLQFIRYLPMLKQRGARIMLQTQAPLRRLFSACASIDYLLAADEQAKGMDYHVPLASLPGLLGTRPDTIPADVPYLGVPADQFGAIHQAISEAGAKRRIGIVWSGSGSQAGDRRPCLLSLFTDIARIEDVALFSLRVGELPGDDQRLIKGLGITDLAPLLKDFADTAAAINELDAVISIDTSVAHLAGALGKPVYVLLAFAADWRWGQVGEQSAWYPTATLLRQRSWGDWDPVFAQLHARLVRHH
jgi:tetratricopeptide (TPR) repeat protein